MFGLKTEDVFLRKILFTFGFKIKFKSKLCKEMKNCSGSITKKFKLIKNMLFFIILQSTGKIPILF